MNARNATAPAFLKEAFLSNYLFADVLFSRFVLPKGTKIIFDQYADIFGIKDTAWLNTMWDIISSDLIAKADTNSSFHALARISKLYSDSFSSDELYILSMKSVSMQIKEEILTTRQDITLDTTKSIIESKAKGGDTDCMALVSFLEYHGFLFNPNSEQALKRIHGGACWNHLFSALMGAKFAKNPVPYHEIICAILSGPAQLETLEYLRTYLNILPDTGPGRVSSELEMAFHRGAFRRCKLNPDVLKMMSSGILSEESKCTILKHSKSKEPPSMDIPLDIDKATALTFNLLEFDILSESRRDEYERISSNLAITDIRSSSVYRPLLFVCRDPSTFELYHIAISKCFQNSPFAVLNFEIIEKPSFAHGKENTLISAMERLRDQNSVLLLEHCELLSEDDAEALSKYLSGSYRKNLKWSSTPPISLDLSGMLPVILTSSMPSQQICSKCDVIEASALYSDEQNQIIENLLSQKKSLFLLESLEISDDALKFLAEYTIKTISVLLDMAIGKIRVNTKEVMITSAELQKMADMYHQRKNNFSFFGGNYNGN